MKLKEYAVNMQKSVAFVYTVFPSGTSVKEHSCQCRRHKRLGVRPLGSVRAPGGGHDNSLQYSCPENHIDRGVQQAIVHRISKSQTWLKLLSTIHRTNYQKDINNTIYNPFYNCTKKNKIPRNKFHQIDKRPVLRKLLYWWEKLKMKQTNGEIYCGLKSSWIFMD